MTLSITLIEIVLVESSKQNTTFSFYIEVIDSVIKGAVQSKNTATILEELGNKIVQAGVVKAETEQLIQSGGAATTGDIANVNSQLEQITNYQSKEVLKTLRFAVGMTINCSFMKVQNGRLKSNLK